MSERPPHASGSGGPIKGNDHIRSNPDSFRESYARARQQLGALEGVIGVGCGLKATGPRFTNDIAILVYVLRKKPNDSLPADQRVPTSFEGYRTDVRLFTPATEQIAKCNDDTAYPDIHGGVQIEAWGEDTPKNMVSNGTVACIVRRRGSAEPDNVFLLTCHHVLLAADIKTKPNDGVYHPYKPRKIAGHPELEHGTLLGRIDKNDVFKGHVDEDGNPVDTPEGSPPEAPYLESLPATFDGFYVDAGAVHLDVGSYCWGAKCPTGDNNLVWSPTVPNLNVPGPMPPGLQEVDRDAVIDVRDVRTDHTIVGAKVYKIGRSTGRTVGVVTAIDAPAHNILTLDENGVETHRVLDIRYNTVEIVLDPATPNQMNCLFKNSFSDEGDSGSLILDAANQAIALLFSASEVADQQTGQFKTNACYIRPVLDVLKVYIETTKGTSHGAKNATDGSGAGPPATADLITTSTPGITYVSYLRVGGRAPDTPAVPIDLTDVQRARLLAIREELLATPRGKALYTAFVELRRELAYLIRASRPVTVTWHRNKGPAFLAHLINHIRGDTETIPSQIDGIARAQLLSAMCDILAAHGSNPLRRAIEDHRGDLALFANGATIHDTVARLREVDDAGVTV